MDANSRFHRREPHPANSPSTPNPHDLLRKTATALVMLVLTAPVAGKDAPAEFRFHRDGILGTSLDLTVWAADRQQADAVERAVLEEIERLRLILSTYDPNSEISRLRGASGPVKCSQELLDVLEACDAWRVRSGGAFNAHLGELIALWKQAEKENQPPGEAKLASAARQVSQPAWKVDRPAGTVTPLSGFAPNVDALAKGYIVDKAMSAGLAKGPSVTGMLLDIGGDLRVRGSAAAEPNIPWLIGVTDPKHTQENAPPLVRLRLSDKGVATSAHYARHYTIAGKQYSHILDPRTGRTVEGVTSATAAANDAATADALATALCVLKPTVGLELVKTVQGADCLILAADGKQYTSDGWKALLAPTTASTQPGTQPAAGAWPKGHQLLISLALGRVRPKPYVAVWVEDAKGNPVRTITVWGNERKYLKDLKAWWSFARNDAELVKGVTRASRSAGKYELVWDGRDDKGKAVPAGTYTVQIETAREDGPHTRLKGAIECGPAKATGEATPNKEVTEVLLKYGPGGGER